MTTEQRTIRVAKLHSVLGQELRRAMSPTTKKNLTLRVENWSRTVNWDVSVDRSLRGYALLRQVAVHIDLAETEYFSLQFKDKKGRTRWLRLDKKVLGQGVDPAWPLLLKVRPRLRVQVKFYPRDVDELKYDVTVGLFYRQVEHAVQWARNEWPHDDSMLHEKLARMEVRREHEPSLSGISEIDSEQAPVSWTEATLLRSSAFSGNAPSDRYPEVAEASAASTSAPSVAAALLQLSRMRAYLRLAQMLDSYGLRFHAIRVKREPCLLGLNNRCLYVYGDDKMLKRRAMWLEVKDVERGRGVRANRIKITIWGSRSRIKFGVEGGRAMCRDVKRECLELRDVYA